MSHNREHKKLTRAAGVVGLATLVSRLAGFVRDIVVAFFFGAGPEADAFFVAFRIPNLLRRLFAEGTLTIAFVPVFTETLRREGRQAAMELVRSTHGALAAALLVVCVLGELFAPQVVRVMAPGFTPGEGVFGLAVELTRWCLPYIFFISLVALAMGALNSLDHFLAPAAAPILLNLSMIGCALALTPVVDPPILSLALGVLLGGLLQLLFQAPFLRAKGVPLLPAWNLANPALRRVGRLMLPAVFGAAVYQVTVLINTILASFLPSGSVSYLYYADRLIQFPLGVFAIAISTAILPSLSREAADGDSDALVDTLGYGFRLIMFISLPAMAGFLVLAEPLVTMLFRRGQFSPGDAQATAYALMGYAVGLWAFAGVRTVVAAFYALKDTRTPVVVAALALVVNVVGSLALMGPLAHTGLALATSLASAANLAGLMWLLRRRLGSLGGRRILGSLIKVVAATLVMCLAAAAVTYWLPWWPEAGWVHRLARPLTGVLAGAAVYLLLARMLGMSELGDLARAMTRRRA